jgi:hypothetical protein
MKKRASSRSEIEKKTVKTLIYAKLIIIIIIFVV